VLNIAISSGEKRKASIACAKKEVPLEPMLVERVPEQCAIEDIEGARAKEGGAIEADDVRAS